MAETPQLFDRAQLLRNRTRASQAGGPERFLLDVVIDEIQERLIEVNRTFTDPAVITGYPDVWQNVIANAQMISDTDTLPLAAASKDLIVHAMCLHWAPDIVGQIIQSRRALRPDGLFLAALFGGRTLEELRAALTQAEAEISGGLSPRLAPMGDVRDLGGLLSRAGLALPVADTLRIPATYADIYTLMRDIRAMGEGNAMSGRRRSFTPRALFDRAAEIYAHSHAEPDGRLAATFEIVFLAGWAPDSSQPEPLRPGSAKTRLADALGTVEIGPSDD